MYKINRLFFISFFLITTLMPLSAQQKSRVAVLPFEALGVAEIDVQVISGLFETALVKTGVYDVIEQNQIESIIAAQAFSLSGCTDDACAIEVGKLLSAEIIVIGSISRVGSRYIANAKLIDVALGRNVNADSISADDLSQMTDESINLLAYKLAGLTYTQGGTVQIASSFGELFVTTVPGGADVFINDVRRGTSPLVVEKVPFGQISISARKDNMAAEKTVKIDSSDLKEIELRLRVSLGRLFIKSSEPDVTVYLDNKRLGPLESGLFRDLPSGAHKLVLRGVGLLAEENVIIEEGKTITVEVYPHTVGGLRITFPEDAEARLTGRVTDQAVRSGEMINLSAGDYILTVTGDHYEPYEEKINISRAGTLNREIRLEFNREYLEQKAREEEWTSKMNSYAHLSLRLDKISAMSEGVDKISAAEALLAEIAESGYTFPDIEKQVRIILTDALKERIDKLNALIDKSEAKTESNNTISTISFITAAAGVVAGGVFTTLGVFEYETYKDATTTPTAEASRNKLEIYSIAQIAGYGILGAGGILLGMAVNEEDKDLPVYQTELVQRASRLAQLNEGF